MIKNASNLYPFALQDQLSNGLTGQTPSVFLRQDNGSFSAASGSVTEVDSTNYPGLYQITLTAAECNCDVLTIAVSLPDGQEPAILDVVYPVTTGGATPAEIWQYTGGRTVTNTIPTAAQITSAVWDAETRTLTDSPTDISGLATSTALGAVAENVTAIKAKTDTIPQNPAAVGDAMTLTSETVTGIKYGLSTFDPSVSTVTINSTQAETFGTATAQTSILALLETLYSGLYHWEVMGTTLTIYDSDGLAISAYTLTKDAIGNIIAVTPED